MNLIGSLVVVYFTNKTQPLALALKGKIVLITFGKKKKLKNTEIVYLSLQSITISTKTVLHYKGYSPSFSAQD